MLSGAMPVKPRLLLLFIAAAASTGCALAEDAGPAPPAWRIEVDGGSDDHGEIVFSFAEGGVEITQIAAAIPKGTRENNVAQRIEGVFERALPQNQYDVDRRGGEKVIVSARDPAKQFEIRVVRNTTPGTELTVGRE